MLLGLTVLQPLAAGPGTPIESAQATEVSAVEGSGIDGMLACFGCAGVIVGISGGSIGGAILMGTLYPGFFGGCAYLCYDAFS
jgi:hypothetical protein